MPIKTKIVETDDKLKFARMMEVYVRSKVLITPRRVLSASQNRFYDETILRGRDKRGFVEIYRRIDRESLLRIMVDKSRELILNYMFSSLLRKAGDDVTIGVVECDFGGDIPNERETEVLFHISNHSQLDILVPPIMRRTPVKKYIEFLENFVEIYQACSFHSALVPVIPHYSINDISRLFEYYVKKDEFDKNFICVDFNGGNPISQFSLVSFILHETQKIEEEFKEPCARYAINLKYGKATKKQAVVPAKDLAIFTMGFNLFGSNHRMVPILDGVGDYELRTKILNRIDYGYYNIDAARASMTDMGDYEVRLRDVLRDKKLARIFNAERHALEALEISMAIRENRLVEYIESKPILVKDPFVLKRIYKVNESIPKETLLKFFGKDPREPGF